MIVFQWMKWKKTVSFLFYTSVKFPTEISNYYVFKRFDFINLFVIKSSSVHIVSPWINFEWFKRFYSFFEIPYFFKISNDTQRNSNVSNSFWNFNFKSWLIHFGTAFMFTFLVHILKFSKMLLCRSVQSPEFSQIFYNFIL